MSVFLLVLRDADIEQAAMDEKRHADEADKGKDAAGDDGHHLLAFYRKPERLVDLGRRQQPEEMSEKEEQDTDVKQHAAPVQLPAAEELA